MQIFVIDLCKVQNKCSKKDKFENTKKAMNTEKSSSKLLSVARDLFYHNGISDTGVAQIIETSGVSRTVLYDNFGSKKSLVLSTIHREGVEWRQWFFSEISASATTPIGKLKRVFAVLECWFTQKDYFGCFFINSVAGSSKDDDDYRKLATEHKHYLTEFLSNLAKDANIQDTKRFTDQLLIVIDGAIVCRMMNKSVSLQEESEEMLELMIANHTKEHSAAV